MQKKNNQKKKKCITKDEDGEYVYEEEKEERLNEMKVFLKNEQKVLPMIKMKKYSAKRREAERSGHQRRSS